jgi:imidazolonepropionase-like amidohydrolase
MRTRRALWLVALALAGCDSKSTAIRDAADDPLADAQTRRDRWRFHLEEAAVDRLLDSLSTRHAPESIVFTGVTVIDPEHGTLQPNRTVHVADGVIRSVGTKGDGGAPAGARNLNGGYVLPGLVDMHVHSLVSGSQKLLLLANGVTSVRDLDGFPWLLRERDAIRRNRLLAPNLYVSGHILNAFPMDFYATVVRTPEAARLAVREQHRLGYDFIKVHNRLAVPVYRAVIDEARAVGLDVVGHVPHEIDLATAIALGQRTFEHFKGFYLDRSLELSSEDRPGLVRGQDIWICPTLCTVQMGLRGQEAVDFVDHDASARFASAFDRKRWRETYFHANDDAAKRVYAMSQAILRELVPVTNRFLAGTDTGGGYDLMIPGFALHQELRLLAQNGLPWIEALRSATCNPAVAMRREAEFGAVRAGLRADLLWLEADPMAGPEGLRAIAGVVVRGIFLSRATLDDMLERVRVIYAHTGRDLVPHEPLAAEIDALVESRLDLARRGFVHRDHQLEELAALLEHAGRSDAAARIIALRTTPAGAPVY